MARASLIEPITDSSGNVQGAKSCTIYKVDGVTLYDKVMYPSLTSSTPLANPFTSDADGYVRAFTEVPGRAKVKISGVSSAFDSEFRVDPISLGQVAGGTAKFDGKISYDGSVTSGSNLLTVTMGNDFTGFTTADQGKLVAAIQLTFSGLGVILSEAAVAAGVISTVLDATTVRMSVNSSFTGAVKVIWGSDDAAALQALSDTVQPTSASPDSAEVRLQAGIACLGSAVTFGQAGLRLVGAGAASIPGFVSRGTMIVGMGSGQSVLKLTGSQQEIVGIAIDGAGKTATTGLELSGGWYYSTIRQMRISGCTTGFKGINEQFSNAIYDLSIFLCTDGLDLEPSGTAIQKVNFYNFAAERNSGSGIVLKSTENVAFFGGTSQINAFGVKFLGSVFTTLFENFHFEGNTDTMVKGINNGFTNADTLTTFQNCRFNGNGTSGKGIVTDGSRDMTIRGTFVDNWGTGSGPIFDFNGVKNVNNSIENDVYLYPVNTGTIFSHTNGLHYGKTTLCRLTHNATQATTSGANFTLAFNTTVNDPDVMKLDANTIQINYDGTYLIEAHFTIGASAGGTLRSGGLMVGATAVAPAAAVVLHNIAPNAVNDATFNLATVLSLNNGNVVRALALQDSGLALNILSNGYGPFLVVTRLS